MATVKRENPRVEEQQQAKKAKTIIAENVQPTDRNLRVVLNPADCNLDFNVGSDGLTGDALFEEGFAYCWSGARANIGISRGKYCFGCKVIAEQPVNMEDTSLTEQHVCRIGISKGDDAVGNLGETEHSYGFGGTGKFSNARRFSDYGENFGVGDTIVCAVDFESKPGPSIGFYKNGKWLGIAKYIDLGSSGLAFRDSLTGERRWESAVFPHVLLKNVVVQMQFRIEDGLVPEAGYRPWACAIEDRNAISGPSFADPTNCEVIMMVGLPASGKTTWAERWAKGHPEKRYVLLGTNLALDQMKVPGLLRKNNYGERFDRLMDRATKIFNTLLSRAAKTPRNYILDQTNVYKSARKRKLKPFAMYHKIAVVIFPQPEELKFRAERRYKEMGKEVPPEAINEMTANYVLPLSKDMRGADEYFDEVWFPELSRAEAQRYLEEMKCAVADASGLRSISSHSHEGSIRSDPGFSHSGRGSLTSHNSTLLQGQGAAPGSRIPHLPSSIEYQHSALAPRLYTGPAEPGRLESVSVPYHGSFSPPPAADASHGAYSTYHRGSLPTDHAIWPSGSANVSYRRCDADSRIPGAGRYHGYGGSYIQSSGDSRNFDPIGTADIYRRSRAVDRYQIPPEIGGNTYSHNFVAAQTNIPGNAKPDFLQPGELRFQQRTAPGPYGSYGTSGSWALPGDLPPRGQQFGSSPYGPPRPRYS